MVSPLRGSVTLPGDKSISHRAAMFSALAKGESRFSNVSDGGDVRSTITVLRKLGHNIELSGTELTASSESYLSLNGKNLELDCGNSGTSLRLFTGLLSGQNVENVSLIGDESLSRRPHDRVINPLKALGVNIEGREGKYTPVTISKSRPQGFTLHLEIASAQVKSALLLAGLYAENPVTVIELERTRDHTEKMLASMGATLELNENAITIYPLTSSLSPLNDIVPSDPSSAAFFGVAAAIIPDSHIEIKNVLLNPTRIAWVDVLKEMGANIAITPTGESCGEQVGDIVVKYSQLHATTIKGNIIASLIDELPILSVAMSFAEGTSKVRDAKELRVKESDRITTVVEHLSASGINAQEYEDGYDITGGSVNDIEINSDGDHRIAMSFSILNYASGKAWVAADQDTVATSFPKFFDIFGSLIGDDK